uniref:Putative secreted protein n=1 Tax=Anopheles triannulatus TaxID=58253 RepID=A0A2M4B0Y7_9DIPT
MLTPVLIALCIVGFVRGRCTKVRLRGRQLIRPIDCRRHLAQRFCCSGCLVAPLVTFWQSYSSCSPGNVAGFEGFPISSEPRINNFSLAFALQTISSLSVSSSLSSATHNTQRL